MIQQLMQLFDDEAFETLVTIRNGRIIKTIF